ncbi:MAG TPA: mechanosensitive ion channel [Firmicutes bacterium]|nr:mechanosensitive ion channel [Bacillota bacterium]
MSDLLGILAERPFLAEALTLVGLLLVSIIGHLLVRRYVISFLHKMVVQTRITWDDICVEHGVFNSLTPLVPAIIFNLGTPWLPVTGPVVEKLTAAWMILIIAGFLGRLATALFAIYGASEWGSRRPIKGYLETVKLVIYLAAGVVAISLFLGVSPLVLLSGLGALTAVLMLIFQDTILSFVAGIRIINNDLVRVGDWIEMPKFEADGFVIEAGLHTVKVQNWDKTISHIPTHRLVEDPFRNWRGMAESGGRRIKRAIMIDQSSIRFCDEEMLDRYERIQLIRDYVRSRRREIAEYNQAYQVDPSHIVNGRRMTNLGTFRAYVTAYLRNHPRIRQDMMLLVRHLQPTAEGLPIEIYCFVNDTAWVNYEGVQADIFDHILAAVPHFDLRVFQSPSGYDLQTLGANRVNGAMRPVD